MREKFDWAKVKREIAEDEKVFKSRPVLLTQQEITAMLQKRNSKQTGEIRDDRM